jgi:hypothetical protein
MPAKHIIGIGISIGAATALVATAASMRLPASVLNAATLNDQQRQSAQVADAETAMRGVANKIADRFLFEKQQCGAAGAADARYDITAQFYRQVATEILSNDTSTLTGRQKAAHNTLVFSDWVKVNAPAVIDGQTNPLALAPQGALITFASPQDLVVTDAATGRDNRVMAIAQRREDNVQMTVAAVVEGKAFNVRKTFERASALVAQPNVSALKNGQFIVARQYDGVFPPNVPARTQASVKASGAWNAASPSGGTVFNALNCK